MHYMTVLFAVRNDAIRGDLLYVAFPARPVEDGGRRPAGRLG